MAFLVGLCLPLSPFPTRMQVLIHFQAKFAADVKEEDAPSTRSRKDRKSMLKFGGIGSLLGIKNKKAREEGERPKRMLISVQQRSNISGDVFEMRRKKAERRFQVKQNFETKGTDNDAELQRWMKFDLFFGIFVLANAVTIGFEANDPYLRDGDKGFWEDRNWTWYKKFVVLISSLSFSHMYPGQWVSKVPP